MQLWDFNDMSINACVSMTHVWYLCFSLNFKWPKEEPSLKVIFFDLSVHENKSRFPDTTLSMVAIHIQIDVYAQTWQIRLFSNLNFLYNLLCLMQKSWGVNGWLKTFRIVGIISNDTRNTLATLFTSSDIALTPTPTISSHTANIYSWSTADHWKL